jgi:hypothetical protein
VTDDEQFGQWQELLESAIIPDVRWLLVQRYVFREVRSLVERNPRIQRPSVFYSVWGSTFARSALVGLRRQVDEDHRVASLARLLQEIRRAPHVISRDRFVSLYILKDDGHRDFDILTEEGAREVDPHRVQDDLSRLRRSTAGLERFATQRVAHFDLEASPRIPTYAELDAALDLLEELSNRYRGLLLAEAGSLTPTINYDWKAIFREPWIIPPTELGPPGSDAPTVGPRKGTLTAPLRREQPPREES